MTSSGGGTSRSDDGGRQRRRALRAHADLFASAIKEETDRLSKLANVVEALIQAGDGHIVEAMQVADTHVAGVCVLGGEKSASGPRFSGGIGFPQLLHTRPSRAGYFKFTGRGFRPRLVSRWTHSGVRAARGVVHNEAPGPHLGTQKPVHPGRAGNLPISYALSPFHPVFGISFGG